MNSRRARTRTAAFLVLLAVVGVAGVARGDTFTDENRGFSLNVPKSWRAIPIANEEDWIVAKWLCDREYADPKEGSTHTPDLKVIIFPHDLKRSVEVDKVDDGFSFLRVKNPYKNYKEYVKSDGQGGRYVSKEEDIVVNGMKTTWYEVKFEKLTAARRAIAFMYHTDDVDYVAQYEALECQWDKLSPAYIASLKSFKTFPPKKALKGETTGGNIVLKDTSKMTPEEKAKEKADRFERNVAKATERLTDGWTVKRSKNYVAISHVDDKFTSKVLEQAEAVRAWCEQNFGYLGDGTITGKIIRICLDSKEQNAFSDVSSRSGIGWGGIGEIVIARDDGAWGFRSVNSGIAQGWMRDKNPDVASAMPPWLSNGLRDYVRLAYAKGGRLDFGQDVDDLISLKVAAKTGKLIKPKEMLTLTYDELWEKEKASAAEPGNKSGLRGFGGSAYGQLSGLFRYLIAGPGAKNPRTKDLLKNYIKSIQDLVGEDKPTVVGSTDTPATEEEEDKRFKETLQKIFDKTFSAWTDADWTAFEKSYTASVS